MKKLIILAAAFFAFGTSAVWSHDTFVQGGLSLGTNLVEIEDSHSIEFKMDSFFLGYKGFHTLQIIEAKDDNGDPIKNKNYDSYIPSFFLGFHADEFYFSVGGELCRFMWVEYNSDLSIPFFYPTVSIGWDIPVYKQFPHNVIFNIDLSWYYCDLGDSYAQWENNTWMFMPKFSLGAKYRFILSE